jgi:hypothetical protein
MGVCLPQDMNTRLQINKRLTDSTMSAEAIIATHQNNPLAMSFARSVNQQVRLGLSADEKLALRYAKAAEQNLAKLKSAVGISS